MTDTIFDTKKRVEDLEKELAEQELLAEASIEAIQFTLEHYKTYEAQDAIDFLNQWNEGNWQYIMDYCPEFDINSEAQQALIKKSGGMPT